MAPDAPARLVAAAHDAGGSNAIAPVLRQLSRQGVALAVCADGPAYERLSAQGFSVQRLTAAQAHMELPRLFERWRPQAALVANSVGESLEDCVVEEARRWNLPSIGVLDAWLLYDRKFAGPSGRWACLPDQLVVMDELAKSEMVALGAPAERLVVLGQPQFDELPARLEAATPQATRAVREALAVAPGQRLVVFLSQDMERFYGGRAEALERLGYTETTALAFLRESLNRLSARRGELVRLAVKLHPREAPEKFAAWGLPVSADRDPYTLMLSADLVVGMDTVLLLEAGLMGCPTLSFQPHRKGTDGLVTTRVGLGQRCDDPAMLEERLEALLFDPDQRAACVQAWRGFSVQPGATQRVADLVLSRLRQPVAVS